MTLDMRTMTDCERENGTIHIFNLNPNIDDTHHLFFLPELRLPDCWAA